MSGGVLSVLLPGDTIDDTKEDVAMLLLNGAALVLTTDPFVAAAAATAAKLRLRGASEAELEAIMRTGVARSVASGDNAVSLQSVAIDPAVPTTGNSLALVAGRWTPSALNLAGGASYVSGVLPAGNLPVSTDSVPGTMSAADKTKLDAGNVVQHVPVDLPLVAIQALTSGVAANIGAALPANAQLMAAQLNVIQTITGGTIAACHATVQNTAEAAGAVVSSKDVFTATGLFVGGGNAFPTRGGQQLQITITAVGDTLANAATGHLQLDLFFTVEP